MTGPGPDLADQLKRTFANIEAIREMVFGEQPPPAPMRSKLIVIEGGKNNGRPAEHS